MTMPRYITEVRKTNAYTTILLIEVSSRDRKVVGVNRDERLGDLAVALEDPQEAVNWDFNPVPEGFEGGVGDPTDPEAWGEQIDFEDAVEELQKELQKRIEDATWHLIGRSTVTPQTIEKIRQLILPLANDLFSDHTKFKITSSPDEPSRLNITFLNLPRRLAAALGLQCMVNPEFEIQDDYPS